MSHEIKESCVNIRILQLFSEPSARGVFQCAGFKHRPQTVITEEFRLQETFGSHLIQPLHSLKARSTSYLALNQIVLKTATENGKISLQMKKFILKLCSEHCLKINDELLLHISKVITCIFLLVLFLQSMLKKKLWREGVISQDFTKCK